MDNVDALIGLKKSRVGGGIFSNFLSWLPPTVTRASILISQPPYPFCLYIWADESAGSCEMLATRCSLWESLRALARLEGCHGSQLGWSHVSAALCVLTAPL